MDLHPRGHLDSYRCDLGILHVVRLPRDGKFPDRRGASIRRIPAQVPGRVKRDSEWGQGSAG